MELGELITVNHVHENLLVKKRRTPDTFGTKIKFGRSKTVFYKQLQYAVAGFFVMFVVVVVVFVVVVCCF